MIKQDMKNNIYKKEYVITKAEYDKVMESYNKCQEDNKDKKYTEEDIRRAIQVGVSAEAGDYPEGWSYKLGITLEDYYINSLNKKY
jgi:hypothetical protein